MDAELCVLHQHMYMQSRHWTAYFYLKQWLWRNNTQQGATLSQSPCDPMHASVDASPLSVVAVGSQQKNPYPSWVCASTMTVRCGRCKTSECIGTLRCCGDSLLGTTLWLVPYSIVVEWEEVWGHDESKWLEETDIHLERLRHHLEWDLMHLYWYYVNEVHHTQDKHYIPANMRWL